MNISRRGFLKLASAASVLAAASTNESMAAAHGSDGNLFALAAPPLLDDPLSNLASDDFKRLIGTEFLVQTENGASSAVLADLTQTSKPVKTARRATRNAARKMPAESFTLSFQVDGGIFSQKTFRVWHPSIGEFDLFLVPHSPGDKTLLVAVVNRI